MESEESRSFAAMVTDAKCNKETRALPILDKIYSDHIIAANNLGTSDYTGNQGQ